MRNLVFVSGPVWASLIFVLASSNARADSNVVGGTKVPRGAWREVVAVLGDFGVCTGTLIAPDVVLTAGHCIDAHPTEVVVDTLDYERPGGQRIAVTESRAYPDWQDRYDVGILMLDHIALPKPATIAAACTARSQIVAGAQLRTVGFGVTSTDGEDANTVLHEVRLPVRDPACTGDEACIAEIAPSGEFTAGGRGLDSCFGDSGGPAFLDTPSGPALVGVVSRGIADATHACGDGGIYVRVDKVMTWVRRVTGRTYARTTCSGPADGDGDDDPPDAEPGCSAGRGSGLGALLAVLALARRRGRRGRCERGSGR